MCFQTLLESTAHSPTYEQSMKEKFARFALLVGAAASIAACQRLQPGESAAAAIAPPEVIAEARSGAPPSADSGAEVAELARRVARALAAAPDLDSARVAIAAEGGLVFLAGTVTAAEERERIAALAATVDGVAGVVNKLLVFGGA
jgi:osmotically-inducible protein OsmY